MFYGTNFAVGIILLVLILFVPYYGWSIRPETPPKDFAEYFRSLLPYLIFVSIFIVPFIINWTIKRIEVKNGTKKIVTGQVLFRSRPLFRRKLIIFKPFKLIVFRRGYDLMDLKTGDKVLMELTSLGRLLNNKKID